MGWVPGNPDIWIPAQLDSCLDFWLDFLISIQTSEQPLHHPSNLLDVQLSSHCDEEGSILFTRVYNAKRGRFSLRKMAFGKEKFREKSS